MSAIVGILIIPILMFFMPILVVLGASFGGWVVGIIFPETFYAFQMYFSLDQFQPWQIGAFLGFIGSYFKSVSHLGK